MNHPLGRPLAKSLAACALAFGLGFGIKIPVAAASPSSCTSYLDWTAPTTDRTITWNISIADSPTRCVKISAGQTVRFNGNFSDHPLVADGGTTPSPIESHDDAGNVTFANPGTFGFVCLIHSNMTGAIQVVPAAGSAVPASNWPARIGFGLGVVALGVLVRRRRFVA